MKIRNLFSKPIDRPIEGVIKADDNESLRIEVEEYVITNEIARNLNILFTAYNSGNIGSNGVWISGFFGSGKSHLLKMLALLLENRTIDDLSVLDTFLSKLPASEAMLKADMKKAVGVPSKSILFNIDQKADAIAKTQSDALLGVFSKVFDEFCGYYGQQGYIAKFERDLDEKHLFDSFRQAYQDITGNSWYQGRESYNFNRRNIAKAYARVTGNSEESATDIIQAYRDDFHLSIEDFAERVNDYIQTQEPGFRLNFFVDEVGQYIADNVKLMTNLQTIAESLATRCRGRAWLFVTSQGDMDTVLGQFGKHAFDFSRIQARFKTKIPLNNQDVEEVIQKRLLAKTDGAQIDIRNLYERESKHLATLFNFPDGGISYKGFRDGDHFVASYPFIPYQYLLFQQAIQFLSQHNIFMGKFQSVGQRSMLGVFQDVVTTIGDKEVGTLASFDQMYEGIRNTLKSTAQGPINIAEQQLKEENPFAVQLLKTLFLVKYVKNFRATPRNLRVLMQTYIHENMDELKTKINEALALLEQQTYIQRNNDVYEFLTNEEQDVENEIKQVGVENEERLRMLEDIFYSDIIKETKIRNNENQQDYGFNKRIDGVLRGRAQAELVIDFITPFSEMTGEFQLLASHTMGKPEMLVVLPTDDRFMRDINMYIRTEKYIKQNRGINPSETINVILANKSMQNQDRKRNITLQARDLVSEAKFILSGDQVEINGEEAKTRIVNGFHLLIKKIYAYLRMLGGAAYQEEDIRGYLEHSQKSLFGSTETDLNEAEQEVLNFINGAHAFGEAVTMKKIETRFSSRPYGWYLAAIECITAMLAGKGRIECWSEGNLLENGPLEKALTNTYNFEKLTLQPVKQADPKKVKQLKDFHNDFFHEPAGETDPNHLVRAIKAKLMELVGVFQQYTALQREYPFLKNIQPIIEELKAFAGKNRDFFLEQFGDAEAAQWIEKKQNMLDPVQNFMTGSKRDIFDDIKAFINSRKVDLSNDDIDELGDILDDPMVYAGNRLQEAKVRLAEMRETHQEAVEAERQLALENLKRLQGQMHQHSDFQLLDKDQQEHFDGYFQQIEDTIQRENLALSIHNKAGKYEVSDYPRMMDRISDLADKIKDPVPGGQHEPTETIHISTLYIITTKHLIETEEDVNGYIKALKEVMLNAIRNNKRIQR